MSEQKDIALKQDTSALDTEPQASLDNVQFTNLVENTKLLNNIYKLAKMYSNSTMVPQNYQQKPDNCFVAIELAGRMNVSPILVMQNLYIVQGKPSWSGQGCIALINGSKKFDKDLEFVYIGEPGKENYGCFAKTYREGKELKGTTITMQMAKDEGWLGKTGSKWKTMPDQMLAYRSAAFFARMYCPEVLMGFSTADEIADIAKEEKPKTVVKLEG